MTVTADAETGGAVAQLQVTIGQMLDRMNTRDQADVSREQLRRQLWPVPLTAPTMPLSGGAGSLFSPDTLGPHDGTYWDVQRVTAASFTAGTVNVYLNNVSDFNLLFTFTQAGTWWLGSGKLLLDDTSALVFTATGITGSVNIGGMAIQVPSPLLPDYLI